MITGNSRHPVKKIIKDIFGEVFLIILLNVETIPKRKGSLPKIGKNSLSLF